MLNIGGKTLIRISAILTLLVFRVGAQDMPGSPPSDYNQYGSFSTPSMVVIIIVLIAALFFMAFFSIYIRHCSDASSSVAAVRNLGASLRGRNATRGLDRTILETFPTFGYSEVKDKKIGKGALECAVCLNEFEEEDNLRLIPRCDHVFHPECIDAWLESHVTCPVCRANLAEPEQKNDVPGAGAGAGAGEEVSITILEEEDEPRNPITTLTEPVDRTQSVNEVCPPRTRSVRPKVWPKFPRSHSTGHSLVQPGENLDRFTLRLPKDFRNQVMTRALGRTSSCVVGTGGGRSFKRVDPMAKSDRWVFSFFSRGASSKSGRVADGEGSSLAKSVRGSMKLPSFKCLEPKGDEICLVSAESSRPPV